MTEERKTPDSRAADDPRVSEVYRGAAQERTPAHLDQAVLREATRAARPRYSRLRLWTRPAAWAAVVLLSATLLLQVSQEELPQSHAVPQALKQEDSAAARELAAPEVDAERQRNDLGSAAKATGTTAPQEQEPAAGLLEEAIIQDADMLIRAEEMARMQRGPNDSPAAPPAASSAAPQAAEERADFRLRSFEDASPSCGADMRDTSRRWLECIAALEEAGFTAAAERERQLWAEAFLDTETP
ncbi:MAG: hypothetical protein QNI96_01470 [Woeseiaceae bacterium]|nr:hypothetical protein [Woeseiaceae bacterium]